MDRQQKLNQQLYRAVREGNIQKVKDMITYGADVNTTDDPFRWTPLHLAAYCNKVQMVCLLIHANADLDIPDSDGDTPLHRAVIAKNVEVAQVLINAGARTDIPNMYGNTPRQCAWTQRI